MTVWRYITWPPCISSGHFPATRYKQEANLSPSWSEIWFEIVTSFHLWSKYMMYWYLRGHYLWIILPPASLGTTRHLNQTVFAAVESQSDRQDPAVCSLHVRANTKKRGDSLPRGRWRGKTFSCWHKMWQPNGHNNLTYKDGLCIIKATGRWWV